MFWIAQAPTVPGIGQVLQAERALRKRPQHQLVPDHAGLGAHPHAGLVVVEQVDAPRVEAQRHALQIARQQQVAAGADGQQRLALDRRQGQRLGQRGQVGHLQQIARLRGDAEGVAGAERGVLGQQPARCAHAGATGPRLGCSRRRRMASTHS